MENSHFPLNELFSLMSWARDGILPTFGSKVDGDLEAHIVALSCSESPEGFARWSLRLLADKVVELGYADNISHETIRHTLKKRNKALAKERMGNSSGTKQ